MMQICDMYLWYYYCLTAMYVLLCLVYSVVGGLLRMETVWGEWVLSFIDIFMVTVNKIWTWYYWRCCVSKKYSVCFSLAAILCFSRENVNEILFSLVLSLFLWRFYELGDDYFVTQVPHNNEVLLYFNFCLVFSKTISFSEMKMDQVI